MAGGREAGDRPLVPAVELPGVFQGGGGVLLDQQQGLDAGRGLRQGGLVRGHLLLQGEAGVEEDGCGDPPAHQPPPVALRLVEGALYLPPDLRRVGADPRPLGPRQQAVDDGPVCRRELDVHALGRQPGGKGVPADAREGPLDAGQSPQDEAEPRRADPDPGAGRRGRPPWRCLPAKCTCVYFIGWVDY
jgi:hypothetical protein